MESHWQGAFVEKTKHCMYIDVKELLGSQLLYLWAFHHVQERDAERQLLESQVASLEQQVADLEWWVFGPMYTCLGPCAFIVD